MTTPTKAFQKTVWDYYKLHGRSLPWRVPEQDGSFDPYRILVSEMMLQQTQVNRVVPKYQEFLATFPTVGVLADASLAEVIRMWSGLGYNRRAKYLHDVANLIVTQNNSTFPKTLNMLTNLPGIGPNTAAAILVYAYNQPMVFVETNIRSVFIHHFFASQEGVSDKALLPLINETLDTKQPRVWYWALMDYGSYLKATTGNATRRSQHYAKQSTFQGSLRQLRGTILRTLANGPVETDKILSEFTDERTEQALASLVQDGLIQKVGKCYRLAR